MQMSSNNDMIIFSWNKILSWIILIASSSLCTSFMNNFHHYRHPFSTPFFHQIPILSSQRQTICQKLSKRNFLDAFWSLFFLFASTMFAFTSKCNSKLPQMFTYAPFSPLFNQFSKWVDERLQVESRPQRICVHSRWTHFINH